MSQVDLYDLYTDYAGNSYILVNDLYSSSIKFDTISVPTTSQTVFVAKYKFSHGYFETILPPQSQPEEGQIC